MAPMIAQRTAKDKGNMHFAAPQTSGLTLWPRLWLDAATGRISVTH